MSTASVGISNIVCLVHCTTAGIANSASAAQTAPTVESTRRATKYAPATAATPKHAVESRATVTEIPNSEKKNASNTAKPGG